MGSGVQGRRPDGARLDSVGPPLRVIARHVLHVADGRSVVLDAAGVLEVRRVLQVVLEVRRVGKVQEAALQLALGRQDDRLRIVLAVRLYLLDACAQALPDSALAHPQRSAAYLLIESGTVLDGLVAALRERQLTMLAALVDVDFARHLRVVKDLLEQLALLP